MKNIRLFIMFTYHIARFAFNLYSSQIGCFFRKTIPLAFLLFISFFASHAQNGVVHYDTPLEYKKVGKELLTVAKLFIAGNKKGLSISLSENGLPFEVLSEDTIQVWLPLIGDPEKLMISRKSEEQLLLNFAPIIPKNWGYFQNGTIHIIVSSHQDIAWMNTPEHCRDERIHEIILPALDTMKQYDDYRFEMEQTLNLIELLEEYPEKATEVKEAYKKGQFEWGATFNQPYEGIESGEQLIRQLYWGRKWIKDNLPGMDAHTAYNVDVPGRSMQFPQVLRKGGVENLVISRFGEGFYNWYSPDGTSIFTYSPGNYGWAVIFYKYFERQTPYAMQALQKKLKNWDAYYSDRNIPPHYAVMISQDAAGPIYYKQVIEEWNNIVALSETSLPTLRHSTADEFIKKIKVPEAKFDEISGERPNIWMYIHGPGHYQAIKAKKEASVSLPAAEMFTVFAGLIKNDLSTYPREKFDKAWFKAIYPDHGWGGLNGGVTDSTFKAQLQQANKEGEGLLQSALADITKEVKASRSKAQVVFNDLNWSRDLIGKINLSQKKGSYTVTDKAGSLIPSQREKDHLIFYAKDVPSVGYSTFYLKKSRKSSVNTAQVGANYYENDFYSIILGDGGIKSIYDKQLKKEVLNTSRYAGGDVLSMGYNGFGAGEFNEMKKPNMHDYDKLSNHASHWEISNSGSVFTTFESTSALNSIGIIQRIKIFNHLKRIDFEYEIPDWDGRHNRQLRFALGLNETEATINYESPLGVVTVGKDELPISPGGWSWEGTYRQLSKYVHPREVLDFISANGSKLGITLSGTVSVMDWIDPVRDAVNYPVIQGIMLSTHKSCHGMGPYYEQSGKHTFKFSLTSHESGWKNGYTFGKESQRSGYTVSLEDINPNGQLPEELSFIKTASPFTNISTVKKSDYDDDVILRVADIAGEDREIQVDLLNEVLEATQTNLVEEEIKPLNISGKTFTLPIGHHAVETLKLKLIQKTIN